MSQIANEVALVVRDLVSRSELFTALDVSNKVKEKIPGARHREVRDVVRELYNSEMVNVGYTSTPINVTLADGSVREAWLYHSLVDAWDLEEKYDSQKRQQVSTRPVVGGPAPVVSASGNVVNLADDGSVQVQPVTNVISQPVVNQTVTPVTVTKVSARDAWAHMFNSQASLFPRK